MASPDRSNPAAEANVQPAMEQINRHLKVLDERLDNMDSVITSLVERVLHQPLTLEISCPKCGHRIEVNIPSSSRLRD